MTTPDTSDKPNRNHDDAIGDLVKSLINSIVIESSTVQADSPRERLLLHIKRRSDDSLNGAITALSSYLQARAQERQAQSTEALVKAVRELSIQTTDTPDNVDAQAIIDLREPKRDYLATTFSLPSETLSLLWAMRGMLVDASIKSLSRPSRFDPYQTLTSEEIAWSLRVTKEELWEHLPRNAAGAIDYALMEEFDIHHYGGTDEEPETWMYGG